MEQIKDPAQTVQKKTNVVDVDITHKQKLVLCTEASVQ